MTGARAPELSVVVPSVNGWTDLHRCLAALDGERSSTALEVIVPERCGTDVRNAIAEKFPWARVLPVSVDTTIPVMRARAFAAALAPTVAVIEDHVLIPEGWARQMVSARSGGVRVLGGGVVNAATERTVDWAAFFCEYSHLLVPADPGPARWLTGNNTAYDRALFAEFHEVAVAGVWEDSLHEAFRRRGIVLWNRPDIIVRHKKHYTVGEYATQRFLYARSFAAIRLRGVGLLRRLALGLGCVALPPVLFSRIVSRGWRSRSHRAEMIRSLPLLALFVIAWAAGEVIGSWFGDGGALARVT